VNDYYEVLGVRRDASTDEIKRAYRKIAREHHPDIAGEDGDGEMFKLATRAYEVLSNPEKRRQYDMGVDPTAPNGGFSGAGVDFSDIFESFFGGSARYGGSGHGGPVPRARAGQDSLVRVEIQLTEAVFGATREVPIDTAVRCQACNGSCCQPGTSPEMCGTCHGSGVVQRVSRSFLGQIMSSQPCPSCRGHGDYIPHPCAECSGEGRVRSRRTVTVNIPPGVETGTRIRLSGQGEVGPAGGPPGDLYVEIRQLRHEVFSREGDDLHATLRIPMTAAALGTVVTMETLDGPIEVDIRPGCQSNQVITLDSLGVGRLQRQGRGDLHVHLDVQVPTDLTEEQQELLRQLAQLRDEEHPEARLAATPQGFFARVREKFAGK
jgi:molecular chaperone DnaJ